MTDMVHALGAARKAYVPHVQWVVDDSKAQVRVLHAGLYRITAVPGIGVVQYGSCGAQETEVFYEPDEFYERVVQVLDYKVVDW